MPRSGPGATRPSGSAGSTSRCACAVASATCSASSRSSPRPGSSTPSSSSGWAGRASRPEVIRRTFESDSFHVLDTTHPAALRRATETLDFDATLFVAASKSGTTLETRCHLDYFWEKAGKRGELFAAITDPGSELESLATRARFPRHLRRRADDRRPLLGAVGLRPRAGGPDGRRPRAPARARRGDGGRLSRAGRQSGSGARPRARRGLAGRARQGDDQPEHGRLRSLGRAAAGGVHRQGGQGPHPGAGRAAGRARPAGARRCD